MTNIRIARYPAGTSFLNQGHLLQADLENLFNDYTIGVKEDKAQPNRVGVTFHPDHASKVCSIVTNWMSMLTINYANKINFIEKFKEAGHDVPENHISSVSITADDVLYEDLIPITNVADNHTLWFTLTKKVINHADQQYLDLMRDIRDNGTIKTDRTGTGTKSVFGRQMRFDLNKGFPLLTTKKVHTKSIIHELIWFLNGDTNIQYLKENGVKIWDEWADSNGDLGPVYGAQWRNWTDTKVFCQTAETRLIEEYKKMGYETVGTIDPSYMCDSIVLQKTYDQITEAMELLKNSPDSRRIIVSAWNVGDLSSMKLMPCHSLFQFYVVELSVDERIEIYNQTISEPYDPVVVSAYRSAHDYLDTYAIPTERLSCQLYMRSCDVFLGLPFNIASYALLTHMFAQQLNMVVGDFVWTGGDTHLYSNHAEQVETQLARTWKEMPTLKFTRKPDSIFDYKFEDFVIENYDPHANIKAPVAV